MKSFRIAKSSFSFLLFFLVFLIDIFFVFFQYLKILKSKSEMIVEGMESEIEFCKGISTVLQEAIDRISGYIPESDFCECSVLVVFTNIFFSIYA